MSVVNNTSSGVLKMNQLQLNGPIYKDFYGDLVYRMPDLIAEGRTPMSAHGLMKRRLETQNDVGGV